MVYPLPLLVNLRTFEACARHLSFARAAEELGLTPAAVSKQVRALETHLGVQLFERLPRSVALTTLGRHYYPSVQKALDDLATSTAGLFGAGRDSLVIRSAVSFASLVIAPGLPAFHAAHPAIRIWLYASVWSDDISPGRVDLDIRYGHGTWDGYDSEPLCRAASVAVCPPGTLFGSDPAQDLAALAQAHPIHIIGCENLWTRMAQRHGWSFDPMARGTFVDTSLAALEMVACGLGTAMISWELALHSALRHRVVVAPGSDLPHDQSHFLVTPRDGRPRDAAALVFRDWLMGNLARREVEAAAAMASARHGMPGRSRPPHPDGRMDPD